MNSAFQSASTFSLIVLLVALIGLAGCENPGSLGKDIGNEKADLVIDTLGVSNLESRNFNFYSGGYPFFSAGEFDDPLLGNIKATGLIKPSLPSKVRDDSLTSNSKMLMRVILDGGKAYGDSLAEQHFDIYKVDEAWRSQSTRLGDDIKLDTNNGPIASFSIGGVDSIDVPLPDDWVEMYRSYADTANADSLYKRNVFGLALVPTNGKKIIAPNVSRTKFVVQNPVEEDTFSVRTHERAYMLERNEKALPSGVTKWYSTKEQILTFDLDLSSVDVQAPDVSRAELVFYQDSDLMEQSLQAGLSRPQSERAQLHLVDSDQLPVNIAPGNPVTNGFYSTEDDAFHFQVTPQVQRILAEGLEDNKKFVITLNNDGIIRTSIIHTNEASVEKRPKLIITSLKNSSN
ncbi:hypothetical protein [Fodinibius saliphilus]|uniref:hypothetical protein n=1 Tax=Fodinibius saliphilus TaxID=1920650 RepID=UPI0011080A93|nr:hypothetical protein [Fodinibius saliphilus]